ncbi:MAG: hypothetical protein SVO26_06510 [Chloroflexota bacterium]|nr:hypothetical protein [Chloroflexota bacterium]
MASRIFIRDAIESMYKLQLIKQVSQEVMNRPHAILAMTITPPLAIDRIRLEQVQSAW